MKKLSLFVIILLFCGKLFASNVPNHQIWYTSSDGKVMTPCSNDAFGATILSNTYENGKGIITFDRNITTIGRLAFWNCTKLTSIDIPSSVTTIDHTAFIDCTNLTLVRINSDININSDNDKEKQLSYIFGNQVKEYTLWSSITTIRQKTFWCCDSLISITIPNSVTTIEQDAFYNCYKLTSVVIPSSVTSIASYAFQNCNSLSNVFCEATTPPTLAYAVFLGTAESLIIYVPVDLVDTYKSAWNNYADKILPNLKIIKEPAIAEINAKIDGVNNTDIIAIANAAIEVINAATSAEVITNAKNQCLIDLEIPITYYNAGITDGKTLGDSIGYARGKIEGDSIGYVRGNADGLAKGDSIGYVRGNANGLAKGDSIGYARGKIEGDSIGYVRGNADGLAKGDSIGYVRGNADGLAKGDSIGYARGKIEGDSIGYVRGDSIGYVRGNTEGYETGYTEGKAAGLTECQDALPSDPEGTAGTAVIVTKDEKTLKLINPDQVTYTKTE